MENQPDLEPTNPGPSNARRIGRAVLHVGIAYLSIKFGEHITGHMLPNHTDIGVATAIGACTSMISS